MLGNTDKKQNATFLKTSEYSYMLYSSIPSEYGINTLN